MRAVLLRKYKRSCVLCCLENVKDNTCWVTTAYVITYSFRLGTDWLLVATDTPRTPEVWSKSVWSSAAVQVLLHPLRLSGVHFCYVPEFISRSVHLSNGPEFPCCSSCLFLCWFYVLMTLFQQLCLFFLSL